MQICINYSLTRIITITYVHRGLLFVLWLGDIFDVKGGHFF